MGRQCDTLLDMLLLNVDSVPQYLNARGIVAAGESIRVRELTGGVSNVVLLVELPSGDSFVIKQALPRLRVVQEWLCSIERIWREVEVLSLCGRLLTADGPEATEPQVGVVAAKVPQLLFEDRENYCFAMSAAPKGHHPWKELLLAGQADAAMARASGALLGRLHARSWNDAAIAEQLDDRTFFRDLRLSPYYDRISAVHPDLASQIQRVSKSIWQHRRCLVHGDFSPKNLLVAGRELWLIDFEVGHFGDPAFDLGFFLTHLVLKSFVAGPRAAEFLALIDAFRSSYDAELISAASDDETATVWQRTIGALAGCLLARVDGKSPVDYLTSPMADAVRKTARDLLGSPPCNFAELLSRIRAAAPIASR